MCSLLAHGCTEVHNLFISSNNEFYLYLFAEYVYSMYHVWLIAKSVSWHVHVHLVHK